MKTLLRSLAVFCVLSVAARAVVLDVYWNFACGDGDYTGSLPSNIAGPGIIAGINQFTGNNPLFNSVNSSSGYSGSHGAASGIHNASIAVVGGALDMANSTYFEFTLAPSAGYQLKATSFELGSRSTAAGPTTLTLFASTDGFSTFSTLGSPMTVAADSTWNLVTFSGVSYTAALDTPVTFRLYGTDGAGGSIVSNWRIDDVALGVVAVPEPPTYAAMLVGVVLMGARALRRRKSAVA